MPEPRSPVRVVGYSRSGLPSVADYARDPARQSRLAVTLLGASGPS